MKSRQYVVVLIAIVAALSAVLALPETGFAQQGTVVGTVTASDTGAPLVGAQVTVLGTARGSVTNGAGEYVLVAPSGTHTIRVLYIGYDDGEQELTIVSGETVTVDFALDVGALLVDEIVAIGSRTQRTVLESPVPVDVITADMIKLQARTELNQILTVVVPSFNASYQTISDGTDHINPASMRGLGPDQVLVLINGKRRHASSLVHVNGTFGRGTVGVDLNAIPVSAIKRVEVLRDGASAQYGSDAIAGVINIVLKDNVDELTFNTSAGVTGEGDGELFKADMNFGFPVGTGGYFNVTGEFFDRNRTNRSGTWTRDIFPGISGTEATNAELRRVGMTRDDFSMKTGQGFATAGHAFWNAAFPLNDNGNSQFYSFGGVTHRNGEATGFFRLPNSTARVVPEIHPFGFLPQIHTQITDYSLAGGVRGSRRGWDMDLSVNHGQNKFQFNVENSNNASMGPASPTSFDAGAFRFRQTTGNFDLVRLLDTEGAKAMSLVAGTEFRLENFELIAGEAASFTAGPLPPPKEAWSSVFPGFQPSNEVDRYRNSIALYTGLETQWTDAFLLDIGGRFESYNDFGTTLTGKVATRLQMGPRIAARAAISNGFRAPSLHQVWLNSTSTQFVTNPDTGELDPVQVLTANNLSTVAKNLGVPNLKEETSTNVSVGFTAQGSDNFSLSVDFYHIEIDDRIVLTSRFSNSNPIVAEILAPEGAGSVQLFANAVDTETNGLDIVGTYVTPIGDEGTITFSGAANFTDTSVKSINVPSEMAQVFAGTDLDAVRTTLFNREERNRLETALPRQKISGSVAWESGRLSWTGRATHFGSVEYRPTNSDNDEDFDAKILVDLDFGVQLTDGLRFSAGGNNVFNTFPDEHELDGNRSGERFIFSRRVTQFGINGGFYYARLQLAM